MTERQRDYPNLLKGLAGPDHAARAREGKRRRQEQQRELAASDPADPRKAWQALHTEAMLHLSDLLRAERLSKSNPSRETTNRINALRYLTEALVTWGRETGADDRMVGFFEGFEARLASSDLGHRMAQAFGLEPVVLTEAPD